MADDRSQQDVPLHFLTPWTLVCGVLSLAASGLLAVGLVVGAVVLGWLARIDIREANPPRGGINLVRLGVALAVGRLLASPLMQLWEKLTAS